MISSTDYKARSINLKAAHYGAFAEIGAGQEVARYFFQAGHASATVAKTMSAYDKQVSDSIYGKTGRFVSQERLLQMLKHEYDLLEQRLEDKGAQKSFFTFANTVTTAGLSAGAAGGGVAGSSGGGHCWCGLRFQLRPGGEPCDVILHLRLLDASRLDQQEVLGVLGVNLIYACFEQHFDEKQFVSTLKENVRPGRVDIDFVSAVGEGVQHLSAVGLELVAQKLSQAILFAPSQKSPKKPCASRTASMAAPINQNRARMRTKGLCPGEVLYNRPLLVQRGHFRPITNTHMQILKKGEEHFKKIEGEVGLSVLEISVHKYLSENNQIDRPDLELRIQTLTALGYYVLVSNYASLAELRPYLRSFTAKSIAFVVGADKLEKVFRPMAAGDELSLAPPRADKGDELSPAGSRGSLQPPVAQPPVAQPPLAAAAAADGSLLSWLLSLFDVGTRVLVCPYKTDELCMTAALFRPAKPLSYLYQYFLDAGYVVDIVGCDDVDLSIRSKRVRELMQVGDSGWHKLVPEEVVQHYSQNV